MIKCSNGYGDEKILLNNEDKYDKENKMDETDALDGYRTGDPPTAIDDGD